MDPASAGDCQRRPRRRAGPQADEKLGDVVEQADEAIGEAVESAVEGAKEGFLESIKESISSFFQDLSS